MLRSPIVNWLSEIVASRIKIRHVFSADKTAIAFYGSFSVSFPMSVSTNLIHRAVIVLALSACAQPHSRSTAPHTEPTGTPVTATEVESWTPQITPGLSEYFISDTSLVSINNDTTSQALPIETSMSYTITIGATGDSFSVSGKVDSSTINSRLRTKAQAGDTTKIVELQATLTRKGEFRPQTRQQLLSCSSSSNSTTSRIYELIVPYPKDKIQIGDNWTDTVSNTDCHGKTPLTQKTIREFEVKAFTPWHDRDAVEVQRTVNIIFTGVSTDPNTHLQATGSGSGEATLFLDRKTARLLESNGQTKSTVMIVTSRGQFPFTQLTSTHITAR